ncbi:DUF6187 family protein [Amycolatopsis albispora]|uniref:Uncharacterized protein n=1 Tax=Amycolatopsis albispora TaxID=1804986 RepID=A0A344LHA3_9PSEU|nr:DUF6187 family protein [Amycolatopsis albispora]AXB47427.1 hypothetical protein A4R43_37370 [Amycolatopsis albispora]
MSSTHDTRFTLPAVDGPASTETGVILMGLDARRLLAGLGLASLFDDPGQVTLAVDHARHDAPLQFSLDALVAAGATRWLAARDALAAAGGPPADFASLRLAWEQTLRLLAGCDLGDAGPATVAYLAACWLRREEIDRHSD